MAIAQEWWDHWWEEDWSWEGLAEKPWRGWVVLPDGALAEDAEFAQAEFAQLENEGWETRFPEGTRLATLQDYWRRAGCADDLYPEPGTDRAFTLMHLPPKWRDGTETLKADPENPPEALMALLKAELGREVQETIFKHGWQLSGADHRLQWAGIVLPDFKLATLSPQTRSEDNKIPIGVTANGAAFSGYANFMSAVFLSDAIFSGQGNSVRSDAVKAVIRPEPGDAGVQVYEQAEDMMWTARRSFPSSDFSQSVFMGAARFDNRDFHDVASFDGAKFYREAEFHGSQLHRAILFTQTDFELALRLRSDSGKPRRGKHWSACTKRRC